MLLHGSTLLQLLVVLGASIVCIDVAAATALPSDRKRSVAVQNPIDFKPGCFPSHDGGCKCQLQNASGKKVVKAHANVTECKVPIEDMIETALKKETVTQQIKQKFGRFKENCFPKPSGGCRCNERDENGQDIVQTYDSIAECSVPLPLSIAVETAQNKLKVTEEIKHKFGAFKENCFPKPSGGCRCNEKDEHGNEMVTSYDSEMECKVEVRTSKRQKRASGHRPSQNVRDPVRERAQANYAAVVNELNQKFKGLKEGCFPRPKGCLCVIGKDKDGRDITERRMKESDCKCQPGERGKGCPISGA